MTFHPFTVKPKTCAYEKCGREFIPRRPLQNVCGPVCAGRWSKAKTAEKAKAERARVKESKRALETIPELIKVAQREFNAFIRERDKDKPCICCGRMETAVDGLRAHGWDSGHYRSTGSASHLRFNENNANRQLVYCNRNGAGRAVDYRIGLIQRIGLAAVEALETDNSVKKWTRDELREIAAKYRQKLKELKEAT
jgi:hypothetical protein